MKIIFKPNNNIKNDYLNNIKNRKLYKNQS